MGGIKVNGLFVSREDGHISLSYAASRTLIYNESVTKVLYGKETLGSTYTETIKVY